MSEGQMAITHTGQAVLALSAVALITAMGTGRAEPSELVWSGRIEVASGPAYQGP